MGCSLQFKEVSQVRMSNAGGLDATDCRIIEFYSAFYWQPVQTYFGSLQKDEQHSFSHVDCLQVFEGYQLTG